VAITNITNNTSATQAQSASQTAAKTDNTSMGKDDFMKLLVAQLKNQDPNNPLDPKDLVTQLSQLTSVEKLVNMETELKALQTTTSGMAANQSVGLIGKHVVASGDSVALGASGGTSSAVNLAQDADKASVSIRNDAGRVVRTFDLPNTHAGSQAIDWDGKDDSGTRLSAGTYRFEVSAKDKGGNPIATDMHVTGVVTSVSYERGYPELVLGNRSVPLTTVTSIGQ
jgi:flagellar basal-body rod modification protein FlgD